MSTSWRSEPLPKGWHKIRASILMRDGHCCVLCGAPATDVDHIIQGGGHGDENLRSLCGNCHKHRSSTQGGQASAKLRQKIAAARFRKPEVHPGMLPK